ncbi:selenium-dependent molybdenum cofactor biosynthesis protein YqeB [Dethiosulfatarculus sandiegensis]|uniref:Molybdenum hydroxylase n=1 Tax=Dethiosulfatarculus sandiegensis TaxID=1429043 RepID=A0A0D2GBV9_9BACT|nr:selenium-dependent molybdenum cofactor biosynthesis protein YqeB [Dethiosulfatarculus sandiegensis]KIX12382.1 molybdenum hydroxylase [Dethiosulfatarculus sandiegensis]
MAEIKGVSELNDLKDLRVVIKSAGEMASGVAYRLVQAGFKVLTTEVPAPLAVRRAVSFCEAVHDQEKTVEGLTARLAKNVEHALKIQEKGMLPVLLDPELTCLTEYRPKVVVDAIIAKRNTGLKKSMADLTIGLGPGFNAPDEVHLAIETNRGHNLGRLIYQGSPEPNTGVPGSMAGVTAKRVLRAPADGRFQPKCQLGDTVKEGQVLALINEAELTAQVSGVVRGLIRPGSQVNQGLKVGDIDPRGKVEYLNTISEKARALGGSVLEAIMHAFNH